MIIKVLDSSTLGEDIDLSLLNSLGNVSVYSKTTQEEVTERISDADVLVLNKVKLTCENLPVAKNLKLICITATGFDNVDIEYCKNNGIAVCNVCGYSTDSVAQLTVSLVLSLIMHLEEYNHYVKNGDYTKSGVHNHLKPVFHEISSMTWGIVGYGNIGKKVADVARAFGCRVIVYKKHLIDDVECVDIETLCKESDIITVHLPLTEETKWIIDEKQFDMMKKTAVMVNVARGAVVNEEAVSKALKDGKIGGFATDVYSVEPLQKDNPLNEVIEYRNVLLTPHMAWGAYEARVRCMEEVKKNIEAFFKGEIRNRVDV